MYFPGYVFCDTEKNVICWMSVTVEYEIATSPELDQTLGVCVDIESCME